MASMIILVFGYSFLKLSGIYFLTMCHDGKVSIDLKLWYIRFIQVFIIRETDDCEIPNLTATSSSGKPSRILTRVKKTVQSMTVCKQVQPLPHRNHIHFFVHSTVASHLHQTLEFLHKKPSRFHNQQIQYKT